MKIAFARACSVGVGVVLLSGVRTEAQLELDASAVDLALQPNTPGQVRDFTIQNLSATPVANIFGLNFSAQVGDGTAGPKVTGVELYAGSSIFASFAANQVDVGSTPWQIFYSIDDSGLAVSLPGSSSSLLARLTFDTTGVSGEGPWAFTFKNVVGTSTEYVLTDASTRSIDTILDGQLSIVPEPSILQLFAGGLVLLGLVAAKRG